MHERIKHIDSNTLLWSGENCEKNRDLRVSRPCPCGCSGREGAVGYLSGSDAEGNGFTLYVFDEELYQLLNCLIRKHHLNFCNEVLAGLGEMYADCN